MKLIISLSTKSTLLNSIYYSELHAFILRAFKDIDVRIWVYNKGSINPLSITNFFVVYVVYFSEKIILKPKIESSYMSMFAINEKSIYFLKSKILKEEDNETTSA